MSLVMAMQTKNTENACKHEIYVHTSIAFKIVRIIIAAYQALIFERVVDTLEKEPEGPEVLETELDEVV